MKQSNRLALTGLSLAALLVLARFITGKWFDIPTGDQGLWFQAGLLMVILGAFLVEKHFTKPVDVVANSIAAIVTLLSLDHPDKFLFWNLVLIGILIVGASAVLSMVFQTALPASRSAQSIAGALFRFSTFFGGAKRLFSVVLILSVFSFFEVPSTSALAIFAFWAFVITAEPLGISGLFEQIFRLFKEDEVVSGGIIRVMGPNLYLMEIKVNTGLKLGSLAVVRFGQARALCFIADSFLQSNRNLLHLIKLRDIDAFPQDLQQYFANQATVILPTQELSDAYSEEPDIRNRNEVVGIVEEGTTISQLKFRVIGKHSLEEGQLIKVHVDSKPVIYQINAARIHAEEYSGNEDTFITATAQQVGIWDQEKQTFQALGWVARPGDLVLTEKGGEVVPENPPDRCHTVGHLPGSTYPINVNIHDLVTHHSAILGITGSGKSYLTYELIRHMNGEGIKVIVFDISADYARDLTDLTPHMLTAPADINAFLQDPEKLLAIAEFTPTSAQSMVAQTSASVQRILEWAKVNLPTQQSENIDAKVCVVFEEAHSLIPEWNSVSVRNDTEFVNKTSQAILQGRKYGLGALVVTQRTANITKTILNQCNTIFAFQSFDQTGLEFLKNYIGEGPAQALSTLLKRQVVVFGKASSSRMPVIVKVKDMVPRVDAISSPE